MKEFSNWGHSLLFLSNKCDSQIWGTPLCFFPKKKKCLPNLKHSPKRKKKIHDSQTSLHFISLVVFEDLIQQCLKRRRKFDYMYLMTLILFSQKDWLDSETVWYAKIVVERIISWSFRKEKEFSQKAPLYTKWFFRKKINFF